MGRLGRAAGVVAVAAAVLAMAGARPMAAQAAAQGGSNRAFGAGGGPIDITADQLEYLAADNKAVWRGNVEAIQGADRLRTPALTIYYAPRGSGAGPGSGSVQKMEAEGPVYYVTPTQNARGDHAVYEAANHTITLTGNVVLVQDKNVVEGDRLVIDTDTNYSQLFSNGQTRGQKRVRGVFYPSQSTASGQSASAGGAASPPAARP